MRPRLRKRMGSKLASVHKLALEDGPAAHQLVGGVMAYQGEDA